MEHTHQEIMLKSGGIERTSEKEIISDIEHFWKKVIGKEEETET